MLSNCQLNIAHLYNIPIGNVKKLVSEFFHEKNYVLHYMKCSIIWITLSYTCDFTEDYDKILKKYIAYQN